MSFPWPWNWWNWKEIWCTEFLRQAATGWRRHFPWKADFRDVDAHVLAKPVRHIVLRIFWVTRSDTHHRIAVRDRPIVMASLLCKCSWRQINLYSVLLSSFRPSLNSKLLQHFTSIPSFHLSVIWSLAVFLFQMSLIKFRFIYKRFRNTLINFFRRIILK